MPAADQFRVILHDEGKHQHADVHAVIIGIRGHDDVVVTQVGHVFLHAQGGDEKVQLFILCHPLAALLEAVDGFAPEGEHGLVVGVAHLGDGSAGGVALRDEDGGEFLLLFHAFGELRVREMVAAVPQFAVVDGRFLGPFAGFFLHAGNLFAFGLGSLDLVLDHRHNFHVHVQVVVQVLGHKIVHEGADGGSAVDVRAAIGLPILLFPHVGGT